MSRDAIVDAAEKVLEEAVNMRWYWKLFEIEVEQPDHACGPDCICFKKGKTDET